MPLPSAQPSHYVALSAVLALAVAYHVPYGLEVARRELNPGRIARPPLETEPLGSLIRKALPEATRAGIQRGDALLAVDGAPYTARKVLDGQVHRHLPGDVIELRVGKAGGQGLDARVRLEPIKAQTDAISSAIVVLLAFVMPLFCLVLGFGVAALRPWDASAWILLSMMLSFAGLLSVSMPGWDAPLPILAAAYPALIVRGAWPMTMLLFGIHFPERLPWERDHAWVKWLLLVPLSIVALLGALTEVADTVSFHLGVGIRALRSGLYPAWQILTMLSMTSFFTLLGTKTGASTNPDARRRLRLLSAGAQISLGPVGIVAITAFLLGRDPFQVFSPWIMIPAILAVPLFPLTLAYVIVVQRAMDLRSTVRQGLQYALARSGVRIMQILMSLIILIGVVQLARRPEVDKLGLAGLFGVGMGCVALVGGMSNRLGTWTDQKFFRDAYDAERILTELSEDVRTMVERGPLLETVARKISSSLHVPRVAIVLRQNGGYAPGFTLGSGLTPPAVFQAPTLEQLGRQRQALYVYPDDPNSWLYRDPIPANEERAALDALETQLLLPLGVKDKLFGFIFLGRKRSEEPYSQSDVRLLGSVVAQTALALENSRLTEAVAAEVAHRVRMSREIEIAREVQEQLFPQSRPCLETLDYDGRCRPAKGVGGDYYDFLALDEGALGIAIGDVSGKGVPAALLMAGLQASIRGQEITGAPDLAALMSNVNRLIYERSPSNRYATLFYARYEPKARALRYVNAGHNAPMLLRAVGEIERLQTGGAVVGLLPTASYEEGIVTLCHGDLLLLYTDGISEAMNPADEEWGEARLLAALRAAGEAPASALVERLFADADTFAAGADQHDDMTLVIVKVR